MSLRLEEILPPPCDLEWPQLVVFDVDSTLWDFGAAVERATGIDRAIFYASYNFRENPHLDQRQIANLIRIFEDPEFFSQMTLYSDAPDIMRIEELGVKIAIDSNCMNSEVAKVKRALLPRQIPGLDPKLIFLHDLAGGHDQPKNLHSRALILVEDSPYNVAKSTALFNIFKKIPWNQSEEAKKLTQLKPVVSFDTIGEITDYIYDSLKKWQAKYSFTSH